LKKSSIQEAVMTDIELRPICDAIGVEVLGVDLREPLDPKTAKAIEQAWYDYLVVLVRDQDLTLDQQTAYAANFGKVAVRHQSTATKHEQNASNALMLITNVRENGKPIGTLPDGEMMFHSDTPYYENPLKATLLYAIDVPSHGGNTLFSNSYKAAETLPESIKKRIGTKKALHIYDYGNQNKTEDSYDISVHPHYFHPVFRKHPETGRSALFVSELMTEEILDVSPEESRELLDFLFEHQAKPEFVYEHKWRPGDIMMWDNRCSVHARTDFPRDERRMLRRITLEDEHPVFAGEPPLQEATVE
tara:strand:+ start:43138 stop:44049 length:912 start_codon:yes stop_codon:yes gene_type:complete